MKTKIFFSIISFSFVSCFYFIAFPAHGQSKGEKDASNILLSAKKALNEGKWNDALKLFEKAISLTKGSPEAMWGKAMVYIRKGDYKSAKNFCRSFINKHKKNPLSHSCMGYTQLIWQRSSLAEKAFNDALSLDPQFSLAIAGLGKSYLIAGKKEEAQQKFKEALSKNPEELEAIIGLTEIFISDGKQPEALNILKPVSEKFSDDPVFLFAYAKSLGAGEEAEKQSEKAVDIRKEWAEGYELVSAIKMKNGKYNECVEAADKALNIQSALTDARKTKGICLYRLGKYSEAIATLQELMQKVPNSAEGMYYIGLSYDAMNEYDKAEESYKNAMNMDVKYANPVISLGFLYYRTEKPTSAISTMEKALGLAPKSSLANQVLGDIYYERSNWKKAKEYYIKANQGDMEGVDSKFLQNRIKEVDEKLGGKK